MGRINMAKTEEQNTIIPVRRPISSSTVDSAAQIVFNRLVAEWGLLNAEQIGVALVYKLTAETTRRKGL